MRSPRAARRFLGVLATALALSACGGGAPASAPAKTARVPKVGSIEAPTRELVYSVDALGTLEAYQVVSVPSRLEGVVESLAFEEGATVTPESVIAVVDGVRRDLLLQQAERAVTHAQADVEKAKAAVGRSTAQEAAARAGLTESQGMLARREAARARASGLVAEEEIESVRAQVAKWQAQVEEAVAAADEAKAMIRAAETAVLEAKGREAIARRDASDARVKPPLAGVVQARHVVEGQWVKAGESVATLVDARRLRLRFRVPEVESTALVPEHVSIRFRTAATLAKDNDADLLYVQGSADPVTRMVECLAEVRAPNPSLKPGFFASVTIEVRRAAAAVVVPEESVLTTERGLVVYAIPGNKAVETPVRLGLHTKDGWIEIVDGLAAGTPVAVENASVLAKGMTVEPFPSARAVPPPPAPPAGTSRAPTPPPDEAAKPPASPPVGAPR